MQAVAAKVFACMDWNGSDAVAAAVVANSASASVVFAVASRRHICQHYLNMGA